MSDALEFGPLLSELVGKGFECLLVTNSIKLFFGSSEARPRGTHYLWIDPPWELRGPSHQVLVSSREYPRDDEGFLEWAGRFVITSGELEGWGTDREGATVFRFGCGHSLVTLPCEYERDDDDWYDHWYASESSA